MARLAKPPSFARPRIAPTPPRARIWVFCEGRNTEPEYLSAFADEVSNKKVDVISAGGVGCPLTVVKAARAKRLELKRQGLENVDEVWAAFDRDTHPHIPEAMHLAKVGNVNVAFSNPCFELWALLHLDDHTAALDSGGMQKALSAKMPRYDHAKDARLDHRLMQGKFHTAHERAERMVKRRHDEGDALGNPYTTMHELAAKIAKHGDPDIKLAREKADKIRRRHG